MDPFYFAFESNQKLDKNQIPVAEGGGGGAQTFFSRKTNKEKKATATKKCKKGYCGWGPYSTIHFLNYCFMFNLY